MTHRPSAEILGRMLPLTLGHSTGHRILDLANDLADAARNEALTEAADIVEAAIVCPDGCDCAGRRAIATILAARTGQETAEQQEGGQCPQNPGGEHAFRPVALDPGRFCTYCGNPAAGVR